MVGEVWKSFLDEDKMLYNIKVQEDKDCYMREVSKNFVLN